MRDIELYKQILGLESPWYVSRVELKVAEQRVDIWIEHDFGVHWECPKCSQTFTCRDHAEERVWRHMDTCQFGTYLHARIPRIDCPEHGVLQVKVPWSEPRSRFTLLFECFVIRCHCTMCQYSGSLPPLAPELGRSLGRHDSGGDSGFGS